MTADLTLPAVTAALVRAGVQTVVSVDEEPTMECPKCEGDGGYDCLGDVWDDRIREWITCPDCGGSGRVPLSGDVEIVADGEIGTIPLGWDVEHLPHVMRISRTEDPYGDDEIPIVLDAPVARATVQCVPVVDGEEYGARHEPDYCGPAAVVRLPKGADLYPAWDGALMGEDITDLSDQLTLLDLDAPWALILSDVRPVEDR